MHSITQGMLEKGELRYLFDILLTTYGAHVEATIGSETRLMSQ
jgi:hypothetical protein